MSKTQKELTEAYREVKGVTGIEKDFAEWALNEIPLTWTKDRREQAASMFGNVPVGTVYRGARLETEEQYQKVQDILNGIVDTIACNLSSAAPDYSTAVSFANFVKSYDEMTTFYALRAAAKRGAAGKFGGAVFRLEPTPDQVIVKTYQQGNETEYNSNWRQPKESAESEVILYGNVKVTAVKYIPVLTKENWQQQVLDFVESVSDIDDWQIFKYWADENLSKEELHQFNDVLWQHVIKTDQDLVDALNFSGEVFSPLTYIEQQPHLKKRIQQLVGKKMKKEWHGFSNAFYLTVGNKQLDVRETNLVRSLWLSKKEKNTESGKTPADELAHMLLKSIAVWDNLLEVGDNFYTTLSYANIAGEKDNTVYNMRVGLYYIHAHNQVLKKYIKQALQPLIQKIEKQCALELSMLQSASQNKESLIEILNDISSQVTFAYGGAIGTWFDRLAKLFELIATLNSARLNQYKKQLMQSAYNLLPRGQMDKAMQELINDYSRAIPTLMTKYIESEQGN